MFQPSLQVPGEQLPQQRQALRGPQLSETVGVFGPGETKGWGEISSKIKVHHAQEQSQMRTMVLEYLALHDTAPYFWGFYVGKYSSTMVRIWEWRYGTTRLVNISVLILDFRLD